jgi:hypothetical protein
LAQAQAQVEEILSYLEDGTLDGTDEPFQVYLTCYRVLCAGRDPRAGGVLVAAHRLLQERAARIEDEELRQSFLENVVAHREIIAAYCETQVCQITVRLAHVDAPASRSPRDDEWVEVTWTSFIPEDSQVEGKVARRRKRLLRLLREAHKQSAVPRGTTYTPAARASEHDSVDPISKTSESRIMLLRQNRLAQTPFLPAERFFADLRGLIGADFGSTETTKSCFEQLLYLAVASHAKASIIRPLI